MFGSIPAGKSGTIKNLRITNSTFNCYALGGTFYGNVHGTATFENVVLNVTMLNKAAGDSQIGGFVGRSNDAGATLSFTNCVFDGEISSAKGNGSYNYAPFMGIIEKGSSYTFTNISN
jgi:hypothetical protein